MLYLFYMKKKIKNILETYWKREKIVNKLLIGLFLFVVILAFTLKIIDSILIDLGYGVDKQLDKVYNFAKANGKFDNSEWFKELKQLHEAKGGFQIHTFHLSFWSHSVVTKLSRDYTIYENGRPMAIFKPLISMMNHHPSSIWMLTQFTWITTIIILLFLIFRFFNYEDKLPKWLNWIMTQRTLSLVSIYSLIVGIVFWSAMFKNFNASFNGELRTLELIITIIVHAFIPLLMVNYSFIYLIRNKKASILTESIIFKSMLYPILYMFWYILLTLVWFDPYEVTTMHDSLIKVQGGGTLSGHSWWSEIWKLVVGLLILWIMIGVMILIHNLTLLKFNKTYDPKNDFEIIALRQRKTKKIQNAVNRKYALKALSQKKQKK